MMAFALGLRHGFDLDHPATIDAMTRSVKENARLSKCVGLLFSFGRGLVVMIMSLVLGSGIIQAKSPLWLESVGQWISIVSEYFFVILLGVVFMLGMMTSDGLNGLFVSKLIQLADQKFAVIPAKAGNHPSKQAISQI